MGTLIDHQPVKLILTYDPLPEHREGYFDYVLGEFVPMMEHLGLTMCEAWHTAYGSYPLRLQGFIAADKATLEEVLESDAFLSLEIRLQQFVENYERRIVMHGGSFQF